MTRNLALSHLTKRKTIYQKHEPYPHPNKWMRFLDKMIYFIAFLGPIMTLPQLAEVWISRNVLGVSPITWGSYFVLNIFWFTYGMAHKEKPIIIASVLWLILDMLIVVGVSI